MSERLEDIIVSRKQKLQNIKNAGIDPYPSSSARTHTNKQVLDNFEKLQNQTLTLVGRIRSWRDMGKIIFAHIEDGTAKIQTLFKEDNLSKEKFQFLLANFDIGDFIEVTGALFKTKTGEKTLQAKSYKLLAKSLLPLPSEHYGLADEETRLRKRYLDILLNPEVKQLFVKKDQFWASIRQSLVEKGFLELEMPVLEDICGGAEAEPFVTHHNALNRDFYLRISLELPLKKMLVAGFEKVFEIGRVFRNEGISSEHLQDYMQMEFYWAYADYEQLMELVEELFKITIQKTFGTLKIKSNNHLVDWGRPWKKLDYVSVFEKETRINIHNTNLEELRKKAKDLNLQPPKNLGKGRLIDLIYKKTIRPDIIKPTFLINHPVDVSPLSKRDSKDPKVTRRLQVIAYGTELGNGWSELNDPLDQRARFEEQMRLRKAGDTEAQMMDESFLEALEYGMPPAAGFGLSERLFAVLCDKSIRETVVFPPMRSQKD